MTYTHTTLQDARVQLASRLRDSSNVFWTNTDTYLELDMLITEALRTWQSLSGYWKDRGVFNTVSGTAFYDLRSKLSSLLGYTVTSRQSIAALQYKLLEPATPTAWSGSGMFTLTDLTTALQNRRNQLLKDTGASVTRTIQVATLTPRQQLNDNVMDILRVAWVDADGDYHPLCRDTEQDANTFDPDWTTSPSEPERFSIISSPHLALQLIPQPNDVGQVELVIVQAPAAVDPVTANSLLYVPDDMVWIAQYGALADLLLREGEANDPVRGQYAQALYDYGVKVATYARIGINFEVQGMAALESSVFDSDCYDASWQNNSGVPDTILAIGQNLMALSPIPNGIYSVTFDVLRNAPIPISGDDYLQVGREDLDVILGYAEHLASFKQGGQEFVSSLPLAQVFLEQAAKYNSRLSELGDLIHNFMETVPAASPQSTPLAVGDKEE